MNLLGKKCGDRSITRVFDLCVGGASLPTSEFLASVQYDDQQFGVVIVNVVTRTITPLTATGRYGMLLDASTQPPRFEVNADCGYYEVEIYTLRERGVIAREEYIDLKSGNHDTVWKVVGECSSGSAALKAFEKHGVTFDINEERVR